MRAKSGSWVWIGGLVLLGACADLGGVQMGSERAKTVATGSAGGATATNANAQLERCDQSLGTLAVVEDQGRSGTTT